MREIIYTENAPKPIGPYSQAVRVGDTYYFSGQIGLDPTTGQFDSETDVDMQAKRVMQNIEALLTASGLTWDHVVKSSIFLKDMSRMASSLGLETDASASDLAVMLADPGSLLAAACAFAIEADGKTMEQRG